MSDALEPGWHTVEIDGVSQAYEVRGTGPVMIAHSGGPGVDAAYLRMSLLESALTMVYLDPIGTGRSGRYSGGDYRVATYARFAARLIEHLGVSKPGFIGHSHGGFVGIELAISYPGLLGSLAAYSTAPLYGPDLIEEAGRGMTAFGERWPDRPEAVAAVRMWDRARTEGPARVINDEETFADYLNTILPAYFNDYRVTVAQRGPVALKVFYDPARTNSLWEARDRLGQVALPTLVISGRYDFICSRRWGDEMAAGIRDVTYLKLDESGHFGYLEGQQDEFVRAVGEFARKNPS
jgi:proline iminopeptidase